MEADGEVGLDALLERRETKLLEAGGFGRRERLRELGQGGATPQRKRLAEQRGGVSGPALGLRAPRLGEQLFEALEIELPLANLDHVTGRARQQRLRGQHLTQPRHVDLYSLDRSVGHCITPEIVDQPRYRDRPVRVQKQDCEQRPLPPTGKRQDRLTVGDFERTEQPEIH